MGGHRLSDEEMLKGTTNAIAALKKKRKGPIWLIPVLEKRRDDLRKKLGVKSGGRETRSLIPRAARGFARPLLVVLLALAFILGVAFLPSLSLHRTTHADTFAIQNGFFSNTETNGAETVTLVPSGYGSVRVYSAAAWCAVSGGAQFDIGTAPPGGGVGAALWSTGFSDIGTNLSSYYWPTPLQGPPGVPLAVSVLAVHPCNGGGSGVVTIEIQYSVN